jgi:hypothetical protein
MEEMPQAVRDLLMAAQTHLDGNRSLDEKAAIRRAARTADWQHDPERLAAAEAKRARKNARRACR